MVKDKKLKLRAVATEDIKILSALLQDGLVVSSDLHYQKDDESCDDHKQVLLGAGS